MQAPGSRQPGAWKRDTVSHSLCSSRFYPQGTFISVTEPNSQIIGFGFRNSRNGTGIGMKQAAPNRRSLKRAANHTPPDTPTALGGRVEGTAVPPV